MVETTYGAKYAETKDLTRAEVAKRIRADIKAAVRSGAVPKGTYSVRTESYAGGGSINVTFKCPELSLHNAARIRWEIENPYVSFSTAPANIGVREPYSPEARGVIAQLEAIVAAYNYDGSDIQSDFFNVRFYGHVSPERNWDIESEKMEIALIEAEIASAKEAKASGQEQFLAAVGAL